MNKKELELYIHIPFCVRKCAYCDFLSFAAPERMYRDYMEKLMEEIHGQSVCFQDSVVTSIFLGGGTPSILPAGLVEELFVVLQNCFLIAEDAEITIEANPGTLTMEKLEVYRQSGINRISLGLQSADDQELACLGRIHTYDDFLKSYQRARQAGFANINVDLMSALPGQDLHSWKCTLRKVLMLRPEHISAYSLIIEEGTPFYERYGGGEAVHTAEDGMLPAQPDEEADREARAGETMAWEAQAGAATAQEVRTGETMAWEAQTGAATAREVRTGETMAWEAQAGAATVREAEMLRGTETDAGAVPGTADGADTGADWFPTLPDEDTDREMYHLTKEMMAAQGYARYEVSNYAKPGYECRHNIGYWTGVDYLGLGLGASSYTYGYRYHNVTDMSEYLSLDLSEAGAAAREIQHLSLEDRMEEFMFLGLRMMRGVSGSDFYERFGQNMWTIYGDVIRRMEKQGLMEISMPWVRLTDLGVDVSNYVLSEFLLDREGER